MQLDKSTIKKIIGLIVFTVLLIFCVFNFNKAVSVFNRAISILMPFIIGFCLAFILNVPMKAFERLLFKNENGRFYKIKRPVCIILSLLCAVLIVAFVFAILIPEITNTITTIGSKLPDTMESIRDWAINIASGYPDIVEKIKDIDIDWESIAGSMVTAVKNGGGSLLSTTFSFASSFIGGVVNFFIGLFFAIYILAQKETLKRQTKALLYAVFKEKTADNIIKICAMADETFASFITGQCLEACILGLMFFVSMTIFRIPYALTVSVTIAITALVPIFGAFIGCIVGAFLILVEAPRKVIVFLIMFIVLQQIEGNLIYPHVVGGSVGLPSIWVIVAVTIGGDVMGVAGMLIFVPLVSVVYALVREYVVVRLRDKGVPWEKYGLEYDTSEENWKKLRTKKSKTSKVKKKEDEEQNV